MWSLRNEGACLVTFANWWRNPARRAPPYLVLDPSSSRSAPCTYRRCSPQRRSWSVPHGTRGHLRHLPQNVGQRRHLGGVRRRPGASQKTHDEARLHHPRRLPALRPAPRRIHRTLRRIRLKNPLHRRFPYSGPQKKRQLLRRRLVLHLVRARSRFLRRLVHHFLGPFRRRAPCLLGRVLGIVAGRLRIILGRGSRTLHRLLRRASRLL